MTTKLVQFFMKIVKIVGKKIYENVDNFLCQTLYRVHFRKLLRISENLVEEINWAYLTRDKKWISEMNAR